MSLMDYYMNTEGVSVIWPIRRLVSAVSTMYFICYIIWNIQAMNL